MKSFFERWLVRLLGEPRGPAVIADLEDVRAEGRGWAREACYLLDLFFYAHGYFLRRRLTGFALGIRREWRRDQHLYGALVLLLPQAYVYAGLLAYFLAGGGNWLVLSAHYPLVLHVPVAVAMVLLLILSAGFLILSGLRCHRPGRRWPQRALGACGCAMGALLHYAAFF